MAELYTDKYIDECFYIWYEGGKTFGKEILDKLLPSEKGNIPNTITLQKWSNEYGWIERADALDAQTSIALDNTIINRRVEMYEKHAKMGEELITLGREFLNKLGRGLKTENAAIRAIELGMDTERKSVGLADYVRKLSDMTPEQLDREIMKMLGQKKDDEFIPREDIIEGEVN